MADKQVRIDLVTEDHASKPIGEVADAAAALEKITPTVEVTADTSTATGDLAAVEADAKAVEALSPKIDVTADVSSAVEDLKKVKGTSEEAGGGLSGMRDEADQSRSVLANMVGNSTQDLGALGGVAGTAGMAIGQLAEYATEGNINLSNLAAVAGPMLGLFAATQVVTGVMKMFAAQAQQAEEDTKNWSDAMTKSGSAADNMATHLRDVGEVLVDTADHSKDLGEKLGIASDVMTANPWSRLKEGLGDVKDLFTGGITSVKDITTLLAEAGITVDQWTASVAGGAEGAAQFQAALVATNTSAETQDQLIQGLNNSQADYKTATEKAAAAATVFGEDTEAATKRAEKAHQQLADGVTANIDEMKRKWDELRGALDVDESILNLQTQFDDVKKKGTEAFDSAKKGAEDAEQKQRDYETATIDAKKAVIDLGQQMGLSLNQTTMLVAKVDKGELDAAETQIANMQRNNKINLQVSVNAGAAIGYPTSGGANQPRSVNPGPAPAPYTVNINMPAGSRGVDVVRQVAGQTRRNGRRYGAGQVVNFARK